MRVYSTARSLADEEFAIALNDKGKEAADSGGLAFGEVGKFALPFLVKGNTVFPHGTGGAVR